MRVRVFARPRYQCTSYSTEAIVDTDLRGIVPVDEHTPDLEKAGRRPAVVVVVVMVVVVIVVVVVGVADAAAAVVVVVFCCLRPWICMDGGGRSQLVVRLKQPAAACRSNRRRSTLVRVCGMYVEG